MPRFWFGVSGDAAQMVLVHKMSEFCLATVHLSLTVGGSEVNGRTSVSHYSQPTWSSQKKWTFETIAVTASVNDQSLLPRSVSTGEVRKTRHSSLLYELETRIQTRSARISSSTTPFLSMCCSYSLSDATTESGTESRIEGQLKKLSGRGTRSSLKDMAVTWVVTSSYGQHTIAGAAVALRVSGE